MSSHNGCRHGRPPKKAASEKKLGYALKRLNRAIDTHLVFEGVWNEANSDWAFGLAMWFRMQAHEAAEEVVTTRRNLAIASD